MLDSIMQVSINALESDQCRDIGNSAIDNWLKQKPRKKVKKATVRTQSENALEGVEKEPQGGKLFLEGDAEGEEEEEAGPATPDQSVSTDLEASAEEEAAVVASTTGLPDPDYDSATESDCESDHDYQ